ncbi:MAG: Asp-tRNA(Asn)/Glu-tRNA(Gln) amidotransferase subunit GatC [Desulfovibrio sp.]|nr:Asp-tRNA(Asn)/Glu-tRNA(Gln) amidotransferase subunit GatC [Desulfovibrio sp.]
MSEEAKIGPQEVRHMAELSRLEVSSEEEGTFASQFAEILGYMDVLQEVDVRGIEPLYSPVSHEAWTREDQAKAVRSHAEILANAPKADEQYFIVPKIV